VRTFRLVLATAALLPAISRTQATVSVKLVAFCDGKGGSLVATLG
jgi:hypothetical protein